MKLVRQAGISLSGSSAVETMFGLTRWVVAQWFICYIYLYIFIWGSERSLGASNFLESNDVQKNIFTGILLRKKKSVLEKTH